jgi:hypothetical protein
MAQAAAAAEAAAVSLTFADLAHSACAVFVDRLLVCAVPTAWLQLSFPGQSLDEVVLHAPSCCYCHNICISSTATIMHNPRCGSVML